MKSKYLTEGIVVPLTFLYGYVAYDKFSHLTKFRIALIRALQSEPSAKLMALGVPLLEMTTAILLAIPATRRAGLYISLGMISIFTIYLIGTHWFGKQPFCSCGGALNSLSFEEHVLFNILLIIISFCGIKLTNRHIDKYHSPISPG